MATSPRPGRGRRPAAEVRAAALAAAADLLYAGGVGAVTHERVARHAGVSKTTLYRWWSSAGTLASDAFFERSAADLALDYSGDIARDLREQLARFVRVMTETDAGRAIRGLIAAAQHDDAVRRGFADRYVAPRRAHGARAIEAARAAGELHSETEPQLLIDQLWGACHYRLLTDLEPVDREYTDRLVEQVLRGARA